MDKHWKGEQSLYHNNNFLCKTLFGFGGMLKSDNRNMKIIKELSLFLLWTPAQAVHILSMMEGDISGREAEVRTLRREADALSFQAAAREEEHKTEVCDLAAQLETAHSTVVSVLCTKEKSGVLHSFHE